MNKTTSSKNITLLRLSKGNHKYKFTDKTGRNFIFRSTRERAVAEYFDKNNIEWNYEVKSYDLKDGSTYLPDFSIFKDTKLQKLVEIKGHFDKRSIYKISRFRECYSELPLEVWDRKYLRGKGMKV
jgi:hypothetical protein